jgi:hypothetical protein
MRKGKRELRKIKEHKIQKVNSANEMAAQHLPLGGVNSRSGAHPPFQKQRALESDMGRAGSAVFRSNSLGGLVVMRLSVCAGRDDHAERSVAGLAGWHRRKPILSLPGPANNQYPFPRQEIDKGERGKEAALYHEAKTWRVDLGSRS